ncbi:thiol-disulfide oxidoreductase DCC family protein [Viridibacillus sp. YIM B01967]|uniref:Thiol-disulfide oxidoreductase DCC family protein n=1 Tax=Viridibacillus soli TaxID=2798301 RepID=A0ABS1H8F3_9BACL|nr:thiol-disulfide oxidoreductase DCC family protein [Viridibacillus soli]MBK3495584.1 thiol-disulfide oxidoreductase DCC family protein [Viridibacillus soli]
MCSVILFDGECNFCNQSIQFIIQRDSVGYFQYASLQGVIGKKLLKQYNIDQTIDSIVLIDNGSSYVKSDAILNICKKLSGPWRIITIFLLIPKPIRNFFYEKFAGNRYKLFGKQTKCLLPPPKIRKRFLD